jgi:hypothetical protein
MRWPRVVQLGAAAFLVALTAFALVYRSDIGFKGVAVPITSIAVCLAASWAAAYVVARGWHWLPAPFVAGIVGVLVGGRLGPVGGVLGFLVGAAVTVAVLAELRLTRRSS